MNDFTASSGIEIKTDEAGETRIYVGDDINSLNGYEFLGRGDMKALREFFQAEADERLGRWRWPENPDYVVYLVDGYAVVVDEAGPKKTPDRIARRHLEDPVGSIGWGEFAARAYFDAHPEPKPWQKAKPGEVWVFSYISGPELIASFTSRRGGEWVGVVTGLPVNVHDVVAGRRIWPEVSS